MRALSVIAAVVLIAGGCREADAPTGPGSAGARLYITSDPNGARILVDGRDTGRLTPDTVPGFTGEHEVQVRIDTLNTTYEYNVRVNVDRRDTVVNQLHGPLAVQCTFSSDFSPCYRRLHSYHTAAGLRFTTNTLGSVFLYDGQGQGALWPATTTNSYVSSGMPVFAALVGNVPIALGAYDHSYLAGRPQPRRTTTGARSTLTQATWVVPPTSAHQRMTTPRGLEITEAITTDDAVNGVVVIKLTFRNITGSSAYQLIDPFVTGSGITFTDAYIGMVFDTDIGEHRDDWLSYDPALDMVFAYDGRFAEPAFQGDGTIAPALVGVRALRAPAGSTVVLNGWADGGEGSDWTAGTITELAGFGMLTGRTAYQPSHPDPRIGHLPTVDADMRISVTAGPLTLAPGGSAEIVLAVGFAPPTAGTYQTGTLVAPGDPFDVNRAIYRIAGDLRARLRAAESIQP